MKKVLIITNHSLMLYKFRKELILELLKKNKVIISMPKGEYTDEFIGMGCVFINTEIDRRGINPFKDFKLLFQYFKLISKSNPDVIITYSIKPNIYASIASRIMGKEYYVNITGLGTAFQGGLLTKFIIKLYKSALKKVKGVFFENHNNKQVFLQNQIIPEKKAYLLSGAGVNLNEFTFSEYPQEEVKITFLFVGRIMKEKGVDELFHIIPKVKKEHPHVEFGFIGWYEDDYKDRVETLVSKQLIQYHGFQPDVRPFIKKAHCIVLPSYHEGMSNTLLEGAAMGRPLITSNIHGCMEALIDGKSGYLTSKKDSYDLYEKIKKFISLSYQDKVKMGKSSRSHVERKFDKNQVVNMTIKGLSM